MPYPRDKFFGTAGIEVRIAVKFVACFIEELTAALDGCDVGLQMTKSARVLQKPDDRVLRANADIETQPTPRIGV